MTPGDAGIIAATTTFAILIVDYALERLGQRRDRPPLRSVGRDEPYLGWFEARWARKVHPDVLYAIVVTKEQLLLLRVGGQRLGATRTPKDEWLRFRSARRAQFGKSLAATWPNVGIGRGRHDRAIQVSEIRYVELRARGWWTRRSWPGPAQVVIEFKDRPPFKLILEDDSQLSACARVMEAAVGGAVQVDPALLRTVRASDDALRSESARAGEVHGELSPTFRSRGVTLRSTSARSGLTGAAVTVVITGLASAAIWSMTSWDPGPLQAATGRVVSCQMHQMRRSPSYVEMTLDGPPDALFCKIDRDYADGLREACRSHATVHALYRGPPRYSRSTVHSIAFADGRDIIPEKEATRREHSNDLVTAVVIGALAGLSIGTLMRAVLWWRGDVVASRDAARRR